MPSVDVWNAWQQWIGTSCEPQSPSCSDSPPPLVQSSSMRLWKSRANFPIQNRCNSSMECWTAWGGIWKRRGRKDDKKRVQILVLSFSDHIALEVENRKS